MSPKPVHTGGCQCGAVRYALLSEPIEASICHCRMCQKAFGAYYGPLAALSLESVAWTRGVPAIFRSSDQVERGFCRDCGTPLTYRHLPGGRIDVSLGSLDDPARVPPTIQYHRASRVPFLAALDGLPARREDESRAEGSRQHPDHDTETWPPPR